MLKADTKRRRKQKQIAADKLAAEEKEELFNSQ